MKKRELIFSNLTAGITGNMLLIVALAVIIASCSSNMDKKQGKQSAAAAAAEHVYDTVDVMPVFQGGDTALLKFVADNTIYPEMAKKNNIQGRVLVKFVVEKDGTVDKAKVVRGADPLLDAEALRVVGMLPKFEKPGIKNGENVAVNFMLPITFRLN